MDDDNFVDAPTARHADGDAGNWLDETPKKTVKRAPKKAAARKKPVYDHSDSEVPQRKKRVAKKKEPSETAKRGARFRKTSNGNVRARLQRAKSQKMFVVDKRKLDDVTVEWNVLGSTGNLYKVVMGQTPSCTCPDARKNNPCKHSIFVRVKVLKIEDNDPMLWQVRYTDEELRELYAKSKIFETELQGSHVASQQVRQLLAGEAPRHENGRKEATGDCAICYDELNDGQQLVWCKSGCGNNLHSHCLTIWSTNCRTNGVQLTCVYCRAPWADALAGPANLKPNAEGYVNLGAAVGLSQTRDVSTYYQGSVAGRGFKKYDSQGNVFYIKQGVGAVDEDGNRIIRRGPRGPRGPGPAPRARAAGNFRPINDDFDEEDDDE